MALRLEGSRPTAANGSALRAARRALPSIVSALAGPLLVVVAVLVALEDVAFGGMVSLRNLDLVAYFLPNHCFLGRSLAAGHIPAWNPYAMGGIPFAADPQSGWLSLPAMALYTALPCDVAVRWYLVLHPILAGLGAYWFVRGEGASRAAATTGGVILSLAIVTSRTVVSVPFSGTLAWTAVLLAAAGGYLRASTGARRVMWAILTALAWGQLASIHLSHGVVLGSMIVAAYLAIRLAVEVRRRQRAARAAWLAAGLLLLALPTVNLAILLPRLAFLSDTSLALGYLRLEELTAELTGSVPQAPVIRAMRPAWVLDLVRPAGSFVGSVALLLAPAALWLRERRPLVFTLVGFGAFCYVASLRPVATFLSPVLRGVPFGDFYLHAPYRFRYGVLLVVALLAAFGVEAWRRGGPPRTRMAMILPGALAVAGTWLLAGVGPGAWPGLPLGLALVAVTLAVTAIRPPAALLVPLLAAAELAVISLVHPLPALQDPRAFVRPDPVVSAIDAGEPGRLLTLSPDREVGRRMLASVRSILFGIEEAQGYNPVQPVRYWGLVRGLNRSRIKPNSALLTDPDQRVVDLFQVGWIARAGAEAPPGGWRPVADEGGTTLFRANSPGPRASVMTRWRVLPAGESLLAVTDDGFDPSAEVILEDDVGMEPGAGGQGRATYRWLGSQAARVDVEAPGPAVVLVRNTFDPGWRATLDGAPVAVLPGDFAFQAVPVPAGRHTLVLEYDDPWIGLGLLGSLATLAAAAGVLLWLAMRASRRGRPDPGAPGVQPAPTARRGTDDGAPGAALR